MNSYNLLAPIYDVVADRAFRRAREASLAALHERPAGDVLVDGIGTGLDLPYLPRHHRYAALDLTRGMIRRALPRAEGFDIAWVQGNSERLPFRDSVFDYAVLHLIVAVVPHPAKALAEAARVVKSGGGLLVFDKFLQRGRSALLRRALSPIASRIATRTDVVFEDLLDAVPALRVASEEPAMLGGWFRRLTLLKA